MTNLYEMEVSVDSKALLNALSKIKKVRPNRVTVPILGAVVFWIEDDRLVMQGGDCDIGIREVQFKRSSGVGSAVMKMELSSSLRKDENGKYCHNPEKFSVGYNAKYMVQVCGVIADEFEILYLNDAAPALVKDKAFPDVTMVIMPLRI